MAEVAVDGCEEGIEAVAGEIVASHSVLGVEVADQPAIRARDESGGDATLLA